MTSEQRLAQSSGFLDAALVLLRVVLGVVFIAHGAQKAFQFGIAGTVASFAEMGVVLPTMTAPVVTFIEFFGGIALVLGLFTRVAAWGIAVVMLGAILVVHLPAGDRRHARVADPWGTVLRVCSAEADYDALGQKQKITASMK